MIRLITEKRNIKEGYGKPCEGIFWIIDNQLITYMDPVGFNNNLDHKKVWTSIKHQYGNVPFDYYPRGRVMVNEIRDSDGVLQKYRAFIYIDDCINSEEVIDEIRHRFDLDRTHCEIVYIGSDGGITSNHYQCHNCRR